MPKCRRIKKKCRRRSQVSPNPTQTSSFIHSYLAGEDLISQLSANFEIAHVELKRTLEIGKFYQHVLYFQLTKATIGRRLISVVEKSLQKSKDTLKVQDAACKYPYQIVGFKFLLVKVAEKVVWELNRAIIHAKIDLEHDFNQG